MAVQVAVSQNTDFTQQLTHQLQYIQAKTL